MVFFIPWRVVAEESGAAHFGLGGALLLDPLGPLVRPPAAPSISILVLHRALSDLQRMKLCYSAAASSAPRSVFSWCD
jgi:hypothetical protein